MYSLLRCSLISTLLSVLFLNDGVISKETEDKSWSPDWSTTGSPYSTTAYPWTTGYPKTTTTDYPWTTDYPKTTTAYPWTTGYPRTTTDYPWTTGYPRTSTDYPWESTTGYPWTTTDYPWTTGYPRTSTDYPWESTTGYPWTTTDYPWWSTTGYPRTTTYYPWGSTTDRWTSEDPWTRPTTEDPWTRPTTERWTTHPGPQRHCPVGWIEVPNESVCFKFLEGISTSISWMQAQKMCEDLSNEYTSSFLAEVTQDSLHYLLSGVAEFESVFHSVEGWFIGLSDSSSEGSWTWMYSGFPSHYGAVQWWPGYPDYSSTNHKDCALMTKNYDHKFGWVDVPCDQNLFATPICQTYAY